MSKHFDAYRFTCRAGDVLPLDFPVDVGYLVEIEFPGQYDDIGVPGVEFESLDIGDIELGRQMHFHADIAGVGHGGDVAGDNGRNAGVASGVDDALHEFYIVVVDDGIDGEITFHTVFPTYTGYFTQIVEREIIRTPSPHIEAFDTEVYRTGSSLYGGGQRFVRAHGGHDFEIFYGHGLFTGDDFTYFVEFIECLDRSEVVDVGL